MSKRRRTSASPPTIAAPPNLSISFLLPLPFLAQSKLLFAACRANPSVYASALKALEDQKIEEGKEYIDFDKHSKDAWRLLNNGGASGGGGGWRGVSKKKISRKDVSSSTDDGLTNSARLDLASTIESTLRTSFLIITSKITPFTNFETKESAISTLRKIAKSLALVDSQVATLVRSYDLPLELVAAMTVVTGKMSEEERREMVDGELEGKLRELVALWREVELDGVEELKRLLKAFEKDGRDEELAGRASLSKGTGGAEEKEIIEIVSDESEEEVVDLTGKSRR